MKILVLWLYAYLLCFSVAAQASYPVDLTQPKQQSAAQASREPEKEMVVYPNPSSGKVFLSLTGFKGKRTEVRVMNVIGNVVYRENFYETEEQTTKVLDLSKFTSGLYYVKLEADEYSEIRKIIIN